MVDAHRLREVDALVRRRRRTLHPVALTVGGGVLLGGILGFLAWRRSPAGAQALWMTVAALAPAWVAMAGPWRLLWRDDARLVSRLPIGGRALYDRAVAETVGHAAMLAGVLGLAALPAFLPWAGAALARALLMFAAALAVATLLSPAVALAGGSLATSRETQRVIGEVTGAGAGPQMVWVSLLPALAGGAAILLAIARPGWVVLAAAVAGATALFAAARAAAPRVLPAAMRDMAAADRVRLAHVDLDGARGLEKAWGAVAGRLVYEKDVALARRRYPAYFLLGGLITIVAWCVAAFAGDVTRWNWTLGLGAALSVYTVILAGRLVRSPVEEDHLVATLPWSRASLVRAKVGYVAWRAVVPLAVATLPAVARAGAERARLAAWLVAMAIAAIAVGGGRIARGGHFAGSGGAGNRTA